MKNIILIVILVCVSASAFSQRLCVTVYKESGTDIHWEGDIVSSNTLNGNFLSPAFISKVDESLEEIQENANRKIKKKLSNPEFAHRWGRKEPLVFISDIGQDHFLSMVGYSGRGPYKKSIGIGFGKDFEEAKKNAAKKFLSALKRGGIYGGRSYVAIRKKYDFPKKDVAGEHHIIGAVYSQDGNFSYVVDVVEGTYDSARKESRNLEPFGAILMESATGGKDEAYAMVVEMRDRNKKFLGYSIGIGKSYQEALNEISSKAYLDPYYRNKGIDFETIKRYNFAGVYFY